MRRLTCCEFVLLLATAFVVGCAPTKPGPISVDYTLTPSTIHYGDSVTVRISVTNRGLDVLVSKIVAHDTCLSGDDSGQTWHGEIGVQDSIVPSQSTAVVVEDSAQLYIDVSAPTSWRRLLTVYSDGGEASDEVTITYLPRK